MAVQITVKGQGAEAVAEYIAYRLGGVGNPRITLDLLNKDKRVAALSTITKQLVKQFDSDERVRIVVEPSADDWSLADEIKRERKAKGKKL